MARVLVIDDEPDVLLLCRVNLEHAGHDVLEASDGEAGLALVRSTLPDVVVLDLMLPHIDGFTVLSLLRASADTLPIPVLVLTAKAQREDQIRCWRGGAAAFLAKPFAPDELATTVTRILTASSEQLEALRGEALRILGDPD
jgi:DNA-binding response OmpR family regulator